MANKYWVPYNTTLNWNVAANWSGTSGILVTGSCTGTALNISPAQGSLTGYSVRTSTGTSLGTITGGSGTNYTVTIGGSFPVGTKMVIFSSTTVPSAVAPYDDVFFDANSNGATGTSPTATLTTQSYCSNLNFTGFTGGFNIGSQTLNVHGNLTLGAGMSYSGTGQIVLQGSSVGINTNGVQLTGILSLFNTSGSFTLNSNLVCNDLRITCSSFTTSNNITVNTNFRLLQGAVNITGGTFFCGAILLESGGATGTRSFTTNGEVIVSGSGTVISFSPPTTGTTTVTIPNIYVVDSSASSKTITISTSITNNVDNLYIQGSGTGSYTISTNLNNTNVFVENTGGASISFGGGFTVVKNLTFQNTSNVSLNSTGNLSILGSLIFSPIMTTSLNTQSITFTGTGNITSNGKTFAGKVIINTTGTINLSDNLTSTNSLDLVKGTFISNNYNITVSNFYSQNSTPADSRTLTLGSSTITLTSTGFSSGGQNYPWYVSSGASFTLTTGDYEIRFTDSSNTDIAFAGGALTYGKLRFARGASAGGILILDTGNVFLDFLDEGTENHSIFFVSGITVSFQDFRLSGINENKKISISAAGVNPVNFIKIGGGIVWSRYLIVSKINASPSTFTWYASQSTDASFNTGWIFGEPIKRLAAQGVG